MSTQYAYFYLMRADGEGVLETLPGHVAHWRGPGLDDYVGGGLKIELKARDCWEPRGY